MPSTFTSRLKIERQASGENSGNWGNLVNYVFNRLDSSIRGYQAVSVAGSANVTLTSNASTTNTDDSTTDDQVHNAILEFTGALTGNIQVFTDAVESQYTLFNNTSGSFTLTFSNTGHAANGVVVTQGTKSLVYSDGSRMYDIMADLGRINVAGIANNTSSTYFTLPSSDGSANQVLTTNGSGALSFATVSGGAAWQAVKSANFNVTAKEGYFVDTTSTTITATLPASPTLGDFVSLIDYAGTFDTNNLTIARNGKNIQGLAEDLTVNQERAGLTLVFTDNTQGWLLQNN